MPAVTIDQALGRIGVGRFQHRLLAIFGLVWAADAMQVLAIGFAAPSLAASFGLSIAQAIQAGTAFSACWSGPGDSAGSRTGSAGAAS